jgi:hypothetical protein
MKGHVRDKRAASGLDQKDRSSRSELAGWVHTHVKQAVHKRIIKFKPSLFLLPFPNMQILFLEYDVLRVRGERKQQHGMAGRIGCIVSPHCR